MTSTPGSNRFGFLVLSLVAIALLQVIYIASKQRAADVATIEAVEIGEIVHGLSEALEVAGFERGRRNGDAGTCTALVAFLSSCAA